MKTQLYPQSHRRSASTLLFVLWIIAFLSAIVLALSSKVTGDLVSSVNRRDLATAEQMADRGFVVASHKSVKNGDPVLEQRFPNGGAFSALKTKEAALINPNHVLARQPALLEEMIVRWGAPRYLAIDAIEALQDWVDPDDQAAAGGSEQRLYLERGRIGHPYNRPFLNSSEMLLVDEFRVVTELRPDWADMMTFHSTGPLDLAVADAETIRQLTGQPIGILQQFVEYRDGEDGINGTDDDAQLGSVELCLELMGLDESLAPAFAEILTLQSNIEKVVVTGSARGIAIEKQVTYQYRGRILDVLATSTKPKN